MLLREDLRETAQAASILNLIGQGMHRLSEIAGRLGKPATSLSRPLARLTDLGLIHREYPFGADERDGKRSLYIIRDPFLRFWFRFVEPNYSLLESRRHQEVLADIRSRFAHHVGGIWENLARESVPLLKIRDQEWGPAGRWWGNGLDRKPMEIDVVAESRDGGALLLGEVAWSRKADTQRLIAELERKARQFPEARGRSIHLAVWIRERQAPSRRVAVVTPAQVLKALV